MTVVSTKIAEMSQKYNLLKTMFMNYTDKWILTDIPH